MLLKYRPRNILAIVVAAIVGFSVAGYILYMSGGIVLRLFGKQLLLAYLIFVLFLLCLIVNRRVVLGDDTIKVVSGFKSSKIELKDISSLKVETRRIGVSKVYVPALVIHSVWSTEKPKYILYLVYKKSDICEIVNLILTRNSKVELDHEVELIINNQKSSAEIRFNKSYWIALLATVAGVILHFAIRHYVRH